MAITYPDLTKLDENSVNSALDFLAQRLAEHSPTLESKRGVLREIVLGLEAIFGAAIASIINNEVAKSSSLLAIEEDPAGADDEMVDRLLSNFRLTRRAGSKASGTMSIVLDALTPVTIPSGQKFTSGSLSFTADSAYAARTTEAGVVGANDRLISAISGGEYAFTIEVTADEEGSASQLVRGTSLTPVASVPHLSRAYAESDFTGGVDEQTNAELIEVLQEGLAGRNPSNRVSLNSLIRSEEDFADVVAISAIGYGDAEQQRYHSIVPVAFGGRVDVYVRTQGLPQSLKLTKTATLIEQVAPSGTNVFDGKWQFSIARDEAPGFYEIEKIVIAGESEDDGYEASETIRGLDVTEDDDADFIPDVENATEAAFSRFQTAVVKFVDTDTEANGLSVGSSAQAYDIYVKVMPKVEDLQVFLGDRERRPSAADILVKAPVPCFVSLSFEISKLSNEDAPDEDAIKTALASYVNGTGFQASLSASSLAYVIQGELSGSQAAGAISMTGRILLPNGTETTLASTISLETPDQPTDMVSYRTVCFYLDEVDIEIETTSSSG